MEVILISNPIIIDDVHCGNSNYLTLSQCSFSTYIDSGCTNTNSYDATVYCCKIFVFKYVIFIH